MNIDKTKFMAFSSNTSLQPNFTYLKLRDENLEIKSCQNIKYLGVVVDCHLKWNEHINSLCKKLRYLIYTFKQIRNTLTTKQKFVIFNGLIQSILRYGILAWGGVSKTHLKPLAILQKRILKIMLRKDIRHSSLEIFKKYEVLNIRQLFAESLIKYQSSQPLKRHLHYYNTRNCMALTAPSVQKAIGTKNYLYLAPKLFNMLPENLANFSKLKKKIETKKFVLNLNLEVFENIIKSGSAQ